MRALKRFVSEPRNRDYTVAQACVVTGLSATRINHYITRDLGALDVAIWGDGRRTLRLGGLVALRIAHDYQRALAPSARLEAIRKALRSPRKKHVVLEDDGRLIVPVSVSRAFVLQGLQRLNDSAALVASDPKTFQGEPCFKGTRIPVHVVAGIAKAAGIDAAKLAYPKLSKAQIELVCVYAAAHPRRGRPKHVGGVLSKRKPKSSRTISVAID